MELQAQQQEVKTLMLNHIEQKEVSQNELAKQIGISTGTLSNIVNDRWELIKPSMLTSIKSKLMPQDWQIIQTSNFKNIQLICSEARTYKRMVSVIGDTGAGKTTALRYYYKNHKNTYMVTCKKSMRPKQLFTKILLALGIKFIGTIYEIIERIIDELNRREHPLLILDEVSKLSHINLMYLQDLWDSIEQNAGIVLAGVDYFKSNLKKAVERSKMGMPEFYGRVCLWQELAKPTRREIASICKANGITNDTIIKSLTKLQNFRWLYNSIKNIQNGLV